MSVENYTAIASLGLFIMFAGEMITIYDFMIDPPRDIEPAAKILQFISIGVAPASVLVGVSFIMTKQYGSKFVALIIISGGTILLISMIIINNMLNYIEKTYLVLAVTLSPTIFIIVSVAVLFTGLLLLFTKTKKKKYHQ
ncbi:MAG: hypothetical protein OXF28_01345 [Thaumarchaeota archaeon]|nr:hypothetical protein [Nitrososphaerota archaeon]MCY3975766.1 hypothetical protein [Nitrososphaerota archaeon]